jgi:breast cancer 2 susceptibility protein
MLDLLVPIGSSPLRKKRRMSSPFYPGFIEDLSPEDLQNLSEIDAAVSQSNYAVTPIRPHQPAKIHAEGSQTSQSTKDKRLSPELGSEATNHPVTTQAVFTSIQLTSNGGMQPGPSVPAAVGFTSASAVAGDMTKGDYRSPSPEEPPPEQDYDAWFNTPSTDVPTFIGFQSASTTNNTGFVGFTSVGKGTSLKPSEDALENVKKRLRDWNTDFEEEFPCARPPTPQTGAAPLRRPVTPPRPSLDLDKNLASPTPTFSRQISPQHTTFTLSAKRKQFKPPLLSNKTSLVNSVSASPSNAVQSKGSVPRFKPPLLSSTSTLPKPSTPSRATSDSAFRTPVRLDEVNRPSPTKKFTTPFKPGMRPGEPGRAKLQDDQEKKPLQGRQKDQVFQIQMNSPPRKPVYDIPPSLNSPSGSRKGKEKAKEYHFFNLGRFNFISPLADFDG